MRVLIGAGVMLEPQVADHADELYAVLRDERLYAYLDDAPPANVEAVRARLARLETRRSPDGTEQWLNWVVRPADGSLVGYVQATVYPDARADIGYVIGAGYQRRGYALAAVRAMLEELAAGYGVTRLRATADAGNMASIGLLTKLGFEKIDDPSALPEVSFIRGIP